MYDLIELGCESEARNSAASLSSGPLRDPSHRKNGDAYTELLA